MTRGTRIDPSEAASAGALSVPLDKEIQVAEGSVLRTDSVPLMGGFAGHHAEDSAPRRRAAEDGAQGQAADEVTVRADPVAALQLLRERVLAGTRRPGGAAAPLPPRPEPCQNCRWPSRR